jgi:hypothetical protein
MKERGLSSWEKRFFPQVVFIFTVLFLIASQALAETKESEFAMFKRTTSQVMLWGKNGILTVPTAIPVGRGDVYLGITTQDAGKIEDKKLFLTTGSVVVGTSDDVELAYTKRTFIWEDGYRSDIEMDTFHLKTRVLHLTDSLIPQIAVGINASSLKQNQFNKVSEILFNPYIAVTEQIKAFNNKLVIGLSAVADVLYNEGATSDTFFSAGINVGLFEHLFLVAEAQGIGKEDEDPIINAGLRLKVWWLNAGFGYFNLAPKKNDEGDVEGVDFTESSYWMATLALEIPLGKLFKGGK